MTPWTTHSSPGLALAPPPPGPNQIGSPCYHTFIGIPTVPWTNPNLQPNILDPNSPPVSSPPPPASALQSTGFASHLPPPHPPAVTLGLFPRGLNRDENTVTHLPDLTSGINERRNTTHVTQCLSALRRFSAKGSCHTGSTQLISRPPSPTISLAHSTHPSDDCASGEASLLPTSGLPPVRPAPAVIKGPVPLWCITAEGPRCRVQASKTTMRNQRNE